MSTTDGTNGRLTGQEQQDQELPTKPEEGLVSPGSSATGGGTSQPVDEAPIVDVAS